MGSSRCPLHPERVGFVFGDVSHPGSRSLEHPDRDMPVLVLYEIAELLVGMNKLMREKYVYKMHVFEQVSKYPWRSE